MAAPAEYTVEKIINQDTWTNNEQQQMTTYQLLFLGDTRVWKAHRNPAKGHPVPVEGQELSGWKNSDKMTFGFATGKGSGTPTTSTTATVTTYPTGGGRDDATGRSIERQTAAKCAAEIVAGNMGGKLPGLGDTDRDSFAEYVGYLVDTFASAIRGETGQPAKPANPDDAVPF